MNAPLVSVCLPNLNTLPYLQERVDTILGQTYKNWELVVSDNFSDDGAWDFFQRLAKADSRVSVAQAPRAGLYPNWNNCLRRSTGKYVYIATSDDTMAPNCLEEMTAALEKHNECDLAHCPLIIIDKVGARLSEPKWPECTLFARGIGQLAHKPHIRRAPYDGLIHLISGEHVVLSITQLLIRRSLFSRTGEFGSKWGSISDFNWEMKAGLLGSMVHVPDTWATWRLHSTQATASVDERSPERTRNIEEMIQDAVETCEPFLAPGVLEGLGQHWLGWSRDMRTYYGDLRHRRGVSQRRSYQLAQLIKGTRAARSQIVGRLVGKPKWGDAAPAEIRTWLESIGAGPVITSA